MSNERVIGKDRVIYLILAKLLGSHNNKQKRADCVSFVKDARRNHWPATNGIPSKSASRQTHSLPASTWRRTVSAVLTASALVACPMSEEQHELQQELVERYERLRS